MNAGRSGRFSAARVGTLALYALCAMLLAACGAAGDDGFQGYVEGEFVNVAGPLGGRGRVQEPGDRACNGRSPDPLPGRGQQEP